MSKPPMVFYSYSHKDEGLRDKLEVALTMLRRLKVIEGWHDRRIGAGGDWQNEISIHLEAAQIILLLVSPDFIASDYCYEVEMNRALTRHQNGEALVIPILLRPVDWEGAPFASLQALPKDAKPVTQWSNEDEAFKNIAEGIRKVATSFGAVPSAVPPLQSQHLSVSKSLKAAIAKSTTVGESTDVTAVVCRPDAETLSLYLQREEDSLTARTSDIKTESFILKFASIAGQAIPQQLLIRIHAPDCEPPEQSRTLTVDSDTDSRPLTFLLRPIREGRQMLNVEVLSADIALVSKTLRTDAKKSDRPPGGPGAPVGQVIEIDRKKWIVIAAVALQTESETRATGMAFASA